MTSTGKQTRRTAQLKVDKTMAIKSADRKFLCAVKGRTRLDPRNKKGRGGGDLGVLPVRTNK
jgi:hypothetical protein